MRLSSFKLLLLLQVRRNALFMQASHIVYLQSYDQHLELAIHNIIMSAAIPALKIVLNSTFKDALFANISDHDILTSEHINTFSHYLYHIMHNMWVDEIHEKNFIGFELCGATFAYLQEKVQGDLRFYLKDDEITLSKIETLILQNNQNVYEFLCRFAHFEIDRYDGDKKIALINYFSLLQFSPEPFIYDENVWKVILSKRTFFHHKPESLNSEAILPVVANLLQTEMKTRNVLVVLNTTLMALDYTINGGFYETCNKYYNKFALNSYDTLIKIFEEKSLNRDINRDSYLKMKYNLGQKKHNVLIVEVPHLIFKDEIESFTSFSKDEDDYETFKNCLFKLRTLFCSAKMLSRNKKIIKNSKQMDPTRKLYVLYRPEGYKIISVQSYRNLSDFLCSDFQFYPFSSILYRFISSDKHIYESEIGIIPSDLNASKMKNCNNSIAKSFSSYMKASETFLKIFSLHPDVWKSLDLYLIDNLNRKRNLGDLIEYIKTSNRERDTECDLFKILSEISEISEIVCMDVYSVFFPKRLVLKIMSSLGCDFCKVNTKVAEKILEMSKCSSLYVKYIFYVDIPEKLLRPLGLSQKKGSQFNEARNSMKIVLNDVLEDRLDSLLLGESLVNHSKRTKNPGNGDRDRNKRINRKKNRPKNIKKLSNKDESGSSAEGTAKKDETNVESRKENERRSQQLFLRSESSHDSQEDTQSFKKSILTETDGGKDSKSAYPLAFNTFENTFGTENENIIDVEDSEDLIEISEGFEHVPKIKNKKYEKTSVSSNGLCFQYENEYRQNSDLGAKNIIFEEKKEIFCESVIDDQQYPLMPTFTIHAKDSEIGNNNNRTVISKNGYVVTKQSCSENTSPKNIYNAEVNNVISTQLPIASNLHDTVQKDNQLAQYNTRNDNQSFCEQFGSNNFNKTSEKTSSCFENISKDKIYVDQNVQEIGSSKKNTIKTRNTSKEVSMHMQKAFDLDHNCESDNSASNIEVIERNASIPSIKDDSTAREINHTPSLSHFLPNEINNEEAYRTCAVDVSSVSYQGKTFKNIEKGKNNLLNHCELGDNSNATIELPGSLKNPENLNCSDNINDEISELLETTKNEREYHDSGINKEEEWTCGQLDKVPLCTTNNNPADFELNMELNSTITNTAYIEENPSAGFFEKESKEKTEFCVYPIVSARNPTKITADYYYLSFPSTRILEFRDHREMIDLGSILTQAFYSLHKTHEFYSKKVFCVQILEWISVPNISELVFRRIVVLALQLEMQEQLKYSNVSQAPRYARIRSLLIENRPIQTSFPYTPSFILVQKQPYSQTYYKCVKCTMCAYEDCLNCIEYGIFGWLEMVQNKVHRRTNRCIYVPHNTNEYDASTPSFKKCFN